MNRFDNALYIQHGACNPCGVARALVQATDECIAAGMGTDQICQDPAVRVITHQLAYLTRLSEFDHDLKAYSRMMNACHKGASNHAAKDLWPVDEEA